MKALVDRRFGTSVRGAFITALVIASAACRHHPPTVHEKRPPEGEVWLTSAQLHALHLSIATTRIESVSDQLLVGGRVALADSEVEHVFSPVSGRVTEILVSVGDHVRRGDPLAVLAAPDIGVASSDLRKAEADAVAAQHEWQRSVNMLSEGAGSRREVEQAEDGNRRAQAELVRARQRIALFRKGSRGSIDELTQSITLRSVIDGDVIARMATPGIEVQGQYDGGTPFELFTVGNVDPIWVLGDVYEVDFPHVRTGAPVQVRVIAYPGREFHGTIDWVSDTLDPTTRTARVRCVLANADRVLRPEMYVTMSIGVDPERALAIPTNARLRLGEGTVAFVERGRTADGRHRFVRVPIVVDDNVSGPWLRVLRGISEGDRVVVDNAVRLLGFS